MWTCVPNIWNCLVDCLNHLALWLNHLSNFKRVWLWYIWSASYHGLLVPKALVTISSRHTLRRRFKLSTMVYFVLLHTLKDIPRQQIIVILCSWHTTKRILLFFFPLQRSSQGHRRTAGLTAYTPFCLILLLLTGCSCRWSKQLAWLLAGFVFLNNHLDAQNTR